MTLPPRSFARTRRFALLPSLVLALLAAQTGCSASSREPRAPAAPMSVATPGKTPSDATVAMEAPQAAPAPSVGAYPSSPSPSPAPVAAGASRGAPSPATTPKAVDGRSAKNAGPSTRAPVIIYQGDLRMTADEAEIPRTIDAIIDVAEGVGGHIKARNDLSVEIKVPSASFRQAMTTIEAIGGVVGRSVKADDVSEEFHDLEVRLVNLRATRTRLQEFLGKAPSIQDMLTVERELERVAQEIDRIEGRLEFLRTRAAMSVITVQLTAKPKSVPIVVTPPPPPPALRAVDLPVPWVGQIGIDPLLSLHK